ARRAGGGRAGGAGAGPGAPPPFDGSEAPPPAWRATADELAAAEAALGPDLRSALLDAIGRAPALPPAPRPALRAALLDAIGRARAFHQAQRPDDVVWTDRPGVRLVQRFVPLGRAGVYVPGGGGAHPPRVG